MKYLKRYNELLESSDFEPGEDLMYIDILLEDLTEKGYTVNQYFGFKNPNTNSSTTILQVDRRYLDTLIHPDSTIRVQYNKEIYKDYLNGDMSYIIKIYSYMEEKGYTNDFPFGEVTYSDVSDTLNQLIGYMSKERGLSNYRIYATVGATRRNEMAPWDFANAQFDNIDDMKDVKVIGAMSIHLSRNKELLNI